MGFGLKYHRPSRTTTAGSWQNRRNGSEIKGLRRSDGIVAVRDRLRTAQGKKG